VDVFKYLSDIVASIKRLGSILAGDEVGDGWEWQRVALYQAHEMRHYAAVLERVAAGKEGGGIVFPSWDAEGVDGVDSPVPPEEIQGVPQPGVMPEWVAGQRLEDCETRLSVARETIRVMLLALEYGEAQLDGMTDGYGSDDPELVAAIHGMREALASGKAAIGST
jgi:hypothetical protein